MAITATKAVRLEWVSSILVEGMMKIILDISDIHYNDFKVGNSYGELNTDLFGYYTLEFQPYVEKKTMQNLFRVDVAVPFNNSPAIAKGKGDPGMVNGNSLFPSVSGTV